ncbi:MAG TPA: MFS transporter [Ilumatobacter sp.]|nr:MFS transporter [Ilumatobacter sp.]
MSASPRALAHEVEAAPALDTRTKRNILIAMCTALMAVIASVSGLNVAQQELASAFNASQSEILWIINAYTVTLAALLMPIGAIGDRWGRKPVLMSGLGLFVASSLLGAFAGSVEVMIAARVLAGVGAAMIMPVTLSVITSSFPPEERSRAIGIWAGVAGAGGTIGMFVSAFMVDIVNWRWLYALPVVLVSMSALMAQKSVPNSREHSGHRFDVGGSILSLFAIGGLVLGIHEGPEQGWTHPLSLGGLIVGVVALVGFIVWENRQIDPLLDISVFRDRSLAAGSMTLVLLFGVMFGIFLVLFPFFQAVVGWSALRSAVALLPMSFVMMPASTFAPKVSARLGSRKTMLLGLAIAGTGLATIALRASVEGGYMSVLPGLLIIGLGMGITMTPATESITATLPTEKQGVASALNDTSREVGGALGIALFGSIVSAGYGSAIEPALAGFPTELAEQASEGIGSAYVVAGQAGDQAPALIDAAKHAFVDGWVQSMWVGVAMIGVAFLFVALRGPKRIVTTAETTDVDATDVDATDESVVAAGELITVS